MFKIRYIQNVVGTYLIVLEQELFSIFPTAVVTVLSRCGKVFPSFHYIMIEKNLTFRFSVKIQLHSSVQ